MGQGLVIILHAWGRVQCAVQASASGMCECAVVCDECQSAEQAE